MTANPIDLSTVAIVESYLAAASNPALDANVQALISSASQYWLWRTGLSTLNSVASYDEWRDGNGSDRLFLWNRPIIAVQAVNVFGNSIPQSTGPTKPGWVIDSTLKSIALRNLSSSPRPFINVPPWGGTFRNGGSFYGFARGIQNIEIQYLAGYPGATISFSGGGGSGAAAIAITVGGVVTSILLVKPGSGYASAPAATFTGPGTGASVTVVVSGGVVTGFTGLTGGTGYFGTPFDVQDKVTKQVAVEVRRKGWLGQRSQSIPNVGVVSYTSWIVDPDVEATIQNYKRVSQ